MNSIQASTPAMLSRVADSLYWMGRYLERAEHIARLLAVRLDAGAEPAGDDAASAWMRVIVALSAQPVAAFDLDTTRLAQTLMLDGRNPSSLLSTLRAARDNARQVREQLSNEVWENLNRLYLSLLSEPAGKSSGDIPPQLPRTVLTSLYALSGVSYSTVSHGEGWYFWDLGRYIERAQLVSRLLDVHFGAAVPGFLPLPTPNFFDWLVLLKFCTAFEPYCKRFTAAIRPERIAQLLLLDAEFPHSIRFSVDRVREALSHVAPGAPSNRRAACERLAGKLKAEMDYAQLEDLAGPAFARFLADISRQCEAVHDAVYVAYIAYDVGAVL
jgi:uncharacterized alpha-E superfamily protein